MKIMVVGQGGREHAIVMALARSACVPEIVAFSSSINPGIAKLCRKIIPGSMKDAGTIADAAWHEKADLVVIGPEEPLMHGVIDELSKKGIPSFGPTRSLANLEGDKALLRRIISNAVPEANPLYQTCLTADEVRRIIHKVPEVVVKPLGLTGGKGVKVGGKQLADQAEAEAYALEVLEKDGKVLLEERLDGEEYSQMAFSDGLRLVPMPLAQDAKYAYEDDEGLMTGGMGSYTQADQLLPFVTEAQREKSFEILEKVVYAAQEEFGQRYHGVIYGQFMLTASGPKLVETNARFGDPEAINVVSLLKTDPVEVFMGVVNGLPEKVEFDPSASVCKYLVPQGYPERKPDTVQVKIDEQILKEEGVHMVYAGAEIAGDQVRATGSRFAAVLAIRPGIDEAEKAVERTLERLQLKGLRYRKDVATAALLQKRVDHMHAVMKK